MRKETYQEMYDIECSHWWFLGKRLIISTFLDRYLDFGNRFRKILDVGCGTGITMRLLRNYGVTYGIDVSEEALYFCRKRGHQRLTKGDANEIPFNDNCFDGITAVDLLEHLENEEKIVEEFYRVLKKNGLLLISVPAFKFLWSEHDLAAEHKRRYTLEEIEYLIKKRFSILKITYTNIFIFPAVAAYRIFKNMLPWRKEIKTDFFAIPRTINSLLYLLYKVEAPLLRQINFPFGLSIMVAAKKC